MWGISSVLRRLLSTMADRISTVGNSFSTVEGIQYIGEITSLCAGDNISTVEGIQYSERRIFHFGMFGH